MLTNLSIENFALMDRLNIDFRRGFTVLTGETGAGKSILIDSISYVLGSKFSKEFVRTGEDKLRVEAKFLIEDGQAWDNISFLQKEGIEVNKELIIERTNDLKGRSSAKINGIPVNVQIIKDLAPFLLDIHGQHNSQRLLDPLNHMDYLDAFGNITNSKEYLDYIKSYENLIGLKSKLLSVSSNNERDKLMDYLKYQIEEIKRAQLTIKEEEELEAKEKMLSNSKKIAEAISSGESALSDDFLSSLSQAMRNLSLIEDYFPKLISIRKTLEEAYYNLSEAGTDIRSLKDEVYFSEGELDEVNGRLYTYSSMKKKYGKSTKEILENLKQMEERLFELENAGEIIEKLNKQIIEEEKACINKGRALSILREKEAVKLTKGINSSLKDVGLKKANFNVAVINDGQVNERGTDTVRFLISTNTGEPLKPLEKIVSGGELSRIMLSMKSSFIDKDKTPTVIFDEIDTGISGRVAESVGEKMYSISKGAQVLCVTHLPQIAALADNPLIIEKVEEKGRTKSNARYGNEDEKLMEVAKMLSGSKITDSIINNARDMINYSNSVKEKI